MKSSTAFLSGAGVTLAAVALVYLSTEGERPASEERDTDLVAKSLRAEQKAARNSEQIRLSTLEQKVARLSEQEVLQQLPGSADFFMFAPGVSNSRSEWTAALFRRLDD